jgi:hypothetical protein
MNKSFSIVLVATLVAAWSRPVRADSDDAPATRCGSCLFSTLDSRSKYYGDSFPEPFRVEDTTLNNELRFDWEHDENRGAIGNVMSAEVQKSVGIVTLEIQAPYLINTSSGNSTDRGGDADDAVVGSSGRHRAQGFGDIELAARLPLLQYVSSSSLVDNSVGFNLDCGIPTNTVVGKNAELSPGVFDDLAIGNHFTLQTLFSFTHTFGSYSAGRGSFAYGLAFGYAIEDEEFAIPRVERLIPMLELVGNTTLDGRLAGHDALTGTAGLRAEFKPIGSIQPTFGVGYIFPIDSGGREQTRWGLFTSLTFEL